MPSIEWMEAEVRKAVPDAAEIKIVDLTGGQDHFHVRVVSTIFDGMRPLPRQRIILSHFKPYIPHEVHALDLKCLTPEQALQDDGEVFHPHPNRRSDAEFVGISIRPKGETE
ncbi:MAG: BolA/IbaG family iron-sulfur metabolism protein [Candidatus Thermoplasmatota archaeon]|nr:BolA/IbaG family iron-sulfur metabolism protein [Candidatus Thermoplasmatota archaeon]